VKIKQVLIWTALGFILGLVSQGGINAIFSNNNAVNGWNSLLRTYKPDAGERTLADIIDRNRNNTNRVERIGVITKQLEDNNKDIDTAIDRTKIIYDANQKGISRIKERLKVLNEGIDRLKKINENAKNNQ